MDGLCGRRPLRVPAVAEGSRRLVWSLPVAVVVTAKSRVSDDRARGSHEAWDGRPTLTRSTMPPNDEPSARRQLPHGPGRPRQHAPVGRSSEGNLPDSARREPDVWAEHRQNKEPHRRRDARDGGGSYDLASSIRA
jgi:hypothetical protein